MPDPRGLLEPQTAATRAIVRSLSDDDCSKPTAGCPGWTVRDAVAHMTTGAQMFEAFARAPLSGEEWMQRRAQCVAENSARAGRPEAPL